MQNRSEDPVGLSSYTTIQTQMTLVNIEDALSLNSNTTHYFIQIFLHLPMEILF